MIGPLLETKLHAPRPQSVRIARPRLAQRADRREAAALTLVSAPAGFGKTTAALDLLADDPPPAWVSLDKRDNDPALFWSYVVAALDKIEPGLGERAAALLQPPLPSSEPVVAILINDIDALDHDVVLVLDDYHVIDAPDIHQGLAFLLEHRPPQLHLVVITRSDPPLPLPAMRARGELREVRASDLRFTAEETAAYLNDVMALGLSGDAIGRLEARTEGWVAALQLAALSMQGRDDVQAFVDGFSGDDRFILDYLVGEVLERQSDDVRDFLFDTSVLDRLTGPLCDAVTLRSDGRSMLDSLERGNLFVVALDDRRQWYRYHHLFAEVLRARLLDERPDDTAELHRRAAAWFDANDDTVDAVTHALAAPDYELAGRLIELATPRLRRARQDATLRGWVEALPNELIADRPMLAIELVGARMATGDTSGVADLLATAEARLARAEHEPLVVFNHADFARLPAQIEVYHAGLALLTGDRDGAIVHAEAALAASNTQDHLVRGAASALVGLSRWAKGDVAQAQVHYAAAIEHLAAVDHFADVLGCSVALADMQMAQGNFDDAMRTYERGIQIVNEHADLRGAADMHVGLAEVHLERGEIDDAMREVHTARDLGEAAGLPQYPYRSRLIGARLQQARGDVDRAFAFFEDAERLYDTDFSPPVRPPSAWKARLQIATGDLGAARAWGNERGLSADDDVTYVREFELLTYARLLLAEGDDVAADALLTRILDAAEEGGRVTNAREAQALLDRSEAPTIETTPRPPVTRKVPVLVDELSERELDVLRYLRSDLSGPRIAQELHVSLNTFRTHTKNIYMKLAVNNRREALTRAAELNL